jgi:superfamily II DNA helicase RecQ
LKLKVFTFRFSENAGGFDDGPLQEFLADKEVIEFSQHFFVHERTPYLTVVLAYRSQADDERRRPGRGPDPRLELDDVEKGAFDALKEWRAARAKMEGIPPYLIATNKHLAKMIRLKASSRAALSGIEGIGEGKASKYGEEILQILAKHLAPPPAEMPKVKEETQE